MMKGAERPQQASNDPAPAVNPGLGLPVGLTSESAGTTGKLIPVMGNGEEALRLKDRYLEVGRLPHDYVLGGVPVNDPNYDSSALQYIMPTVSTDQVAKKVSY
jgi:hypothetical protein